VGWIIFITFMAAGTASNLILLQITDDVERDLSFNQRPSWRPFGFRDFPWRTIGAHEKMYPQKRGLRMWWAFATALWGVALMGLIIVAPFWSGR